MSEEYEAVFDQYSDSFDEFSDEGPADNPAIVSKRVSTEELERLLSIPALRIAESRTLFTQAPISYEHMRVEGLLREENVTTDSIAVSRGTSTYRDTPLADASVQAPAFVSGAGERDSGESLLFLEKLMTAALSSSIPATQRGSTAVGRSGQKLLAISKAATSWLTKHKDALIKDGSAVSRIGFRVRQMIDISTGYAFLYDVLLDKGELRVDTVNPPAGEAPFWLLESEAGNGTPLLRSRQLQTLLVTTDEDGTVGALYNNASGVRRIDVGRFIVSGSVRQFLLAGTESGKILAFALPALGALVPYIPEGDTALNAQLLRLAAVRSLAVCAATQGRVLCLHDGGTVSLWSFNFDARTVSLTILAVSQGPIEAPSLAAARGCVVLGSTCIQSVFSCRLGHGRETVLVMSFLDCSYAVATSPENLVCMLKLHKQEHVSEQRDATPRTLDGTYLNVYVGFSENGRLLYCGSLEADEKAAPSASRAFFFFENRVIHVYTRGFCGPDAAAGVAKDKSIAVLFNEISQSALQEISAQLTVQNLL